MKPEKSFEVGAVVTLTGQDFVMTVAEISLPHTARGNVEAPVFVVWHDRNGIMHSVWISPDALDEVIR